VTELARLAQFTGEAALAARPHVPDEA